MNNSHIIHNSHEYYEYCCCYFWTCCYRNTKIELIWFGYMLLAPFYSFFLFGHSSSLCFPIREYFFVMPYIREIFFSLFGEEEILLFISEYPLRAIFFSFKNTYSTTLLGFGRRLVRGTSSTPLHPSRVKEIVQLTRAYFSPGRSCLW